MNLPTKSRSNRFRIVFALLAGSFLLLSACRELPVADNSPLQGLEESLSQARAEIMATQAQVKELKERVTMTDQTTQVMAKAIQTQARALAQMDLALQRVVARTPSTAISPVLRAPATVHSRSTRGHR